MPIKIALAGNPNSGKTTMFNELTGSMQYVGNWPGVTVEKKEGRVKGHKDVILVDLPGIYSLSPYTLEEVVTRDFLLKEKPDVIINIVDATNIERNLYLTTQLMETGIPIVIALNMMDIIRKLGEKIDISQLEKLLGCKMIETSALRGIGLHEAVHAALDLIRRKAAAPVRNWFNARTEEAISSIEKLAFNEDHPNKRWYAVKLFERDSKVQEQLRLPKDVDAQVEEIIASAEREAEDDSESIIANARYEYIGGIISQTMRKKPLEASSLSDKIDRVITNRWLALPIFFAIMWGIYFVSIQTLGSLTVDGIGAFFDWIGQNVTVFLTNVGAAAWVNGLVVDGILRGVGAVLGFVPQLMILFFFLSLMEDIGYMSRVAFIMDKIFRKFGLSGKSFIPMLIGTGCSVPGIMASRTIENDRDRKMTIMLTPFVPCGAKLPVFALFTGAFFPQNAWVGPSMYLLGIGLVIISGLILKRTPMFKGKPAPFVMELPPYRMPLLRGVLFQMWDRGKAFIKRAGTVILVASAAIWFLQGYDWTMQATDTGNSMLAVAGRVIAPIFVPLGFGNWQSSVAILTGVFTKETVVATFGVLLAKGDSTSLAGTLGQLFTPVSAYAFMAFILLMAPCIAAISATSREIGGAKWTLRAILYQTGVAYVVACIIFQVGRLVFGG